MIGEVAGAVGIVKKSVAPKFSLIIFGFLVLFVTIGAVTEAIRVRSVKPVITNVLARPLIADSMIYEDIIQWQNSSSYKPVKSGDWNANLLEWWRVVTEWIRVLSSVYFVFFSFFLIYAVVSFFSRESSFFRFLGASIIFVLLNAVAGLVLLFVSFSGKVLPDTLTLFKETGIRLIPLHGVVAFGVFIYHLIIPLVVV